MRPLRLALGVNSMVASGGTELHAIRLAEGLRARGHTVYCATLTTAEDGLTSRYAAAGVPLLRFPMPRLVGVSAARQIRRAAERFQALQIDVVHAHDLYMNFVLSTAGRLASIPVVVSKRWAFHERRVHRATDFVAYRLAQRVLANSAWVARSVIEQQGVSPARVVTIGNFVKPDAFAALQHRHYWRTRFGIEPEHFVVGITAQLRAEKNHALLIESFAILQTRQPHMRLLIVGDGPERANLEQLVHARRLSSRVRFGGHIPDAWKATAAMDLFVLPSKHEGFPNALLEAMAIGVPVAATPVGGIPDLVVSGTTGLLLTRPTPEQIADDLERAITIDGSLATMAARARAHVEAYHSESHVLDLHEALYFDLASVPYAKS